MSFYVTLPSNAVSTSNPDNTTTYYRTQFEDKIILDSDYEVAIVEVIYNLSWFLPVGSIKYKYEGETETIPIIFHDGDTIKKCIEKINLVIQEHIIIKKYNERHRLFLENEARRIKTTNLPDNKFPRSSYNADNKGNNLLVINDIRTNEKEYLSSPMLRCTDEEIFIQFSNAIHSLQFIGQISEILNTDNYRIYKSEKNETNFVKVNEERVNPNELISLVGTLYIYTDIIDYQFVGEKQMPLLRNIVIDYNTTQRTTWAHYDSPHYMRVNKKSISSILIDIRDENGNKILFDHGSLIIKLHFRPKRV
jgi:hypothetical protein